MEHRHICYPSMEEETMNNKTPKTKGREKDMSPKAKLVLEIWETLVEKDPPTWTDDQRMEWLANRIHAMINNQDPATKMFESMGIEAVDVTSKNQGSHIAATNKKADSKNQDNWEEELHELWIVIPHFDHRGGSSHRWEGRIKAFIRDLLASEKKRWVEKAGGMKLGEPISTFVTSEKARVRGYDSALGDVIKLLGEKWGVI